MLHAHLKLLLLCLSFTLGCASYAPLLDAPPDRPRADLFIEATRGDARGLSMLLTARHLEPGDRLEIWANHGDGWRLVQALEADTALADAVIEGSALWIGELPPATGTHQYRLRHQQGDRSWLSHSLSVRWSGLPVPPDDLATELTSSPPFHAELGWSIRPGIETRIMRRDVLKDDDFSAHAVVDAAAGGQFLDEHLAPDSVYAYRLQLVDRNAGFPMIGDTSRDFYVATPSDEPPPTDKHPPPDEPSQDDEHSAPDEPLR